MKTGKIERLLGGILLFMKESMLLFRPYKKDPGYDSGCDGLQIHRGQTLIADVDIPLELE